MASNDESFLNTYVPYLLRRADQTLSSPFYTVLTRYGVARSEWRVLAVLEELGEVCVADLAEAALSPQPTVTHAVRRLEKRGLIARTLGTSDKRQRFISITPTGSQLTRKLIEEAGQIQDDVLAETGDLADLFDQLRELIAIVEVSVRTRADKASNAG